MSYITTGKRAESKKQILSLYPHEMPESNEEKQAYFRKVGTTIFFLIIALTIHRLKKTFF